MNHSVLLRYVCSCLLLGLILAPVGFAADFALVPQLRLEGNYNSNIFFDADDEDVKDDYSATVAPGILFRRHSERLLSELFAQGRFVTYQDNEDLDKTDQLYRGKVDFTATEHLNIGATGQYTIDNQIDRDIEDTGLVLGTAERQRQAYRGYGDLLVAERTRLNISGGYTQDSFDEDEFWSNWGADAALGLNHQLKNWPNTTLQGQLGYNHYASDRDQTTRAGSLLTSVEENNTTDNFSLTLGAETRKTERLTLGLNGGARYTILGSDSEINRKLLVGGGGPPLDLGTADSDSSDEVWGFLGNGSLVYRGERNEVSLGLSHDLKPLSGSGDTAQRTTLKGSWWYQMTTEWRFNAATSYYWNRSDDNGGTDQDVDTTTFTVSPRVRYAFTRDVYLEGRYRYTRVNDRADEDISQRHLVSASLFLQHDLMD